MKKRFDVRVYKKNLRARYARLRLEMDAADKQRKDASIREHILKMPEYQKAKTLLSFVSLENEVDTHSLIRTALEQGKRVAVPCCMKGTRVIYFFLITSLEQLIPGSFGVMEPTPREQDWLRDFSDSICILPGFTFDHSGYRLGYGGGYYDRFLSCFYEGGTTVGVCYSNFVRRSLVHSRYDVPCRFLVTDRGVRKIPPGAAMDQVK